MRTLQGYNPSMKTDSLFYRLFQNDPVLALDLTGLAVPEPGRYRFGSQEVKQTAFRLDGVLAPPADQPNAPLAFIEVQFQPGDGVDWLDWLETVLIYKLPRLTREEIVTMFGFNDIGLKETRYYQQAVCDGETAVLLRLMERRFGPPSEATRKRIASADAETLLVWAERILDAKTLEDVWGH